MQYGRSVLVLLRRSLWDGRSGTATLGYGRSMLVAQGQGPSELVVLRRLRQLPCVYSTYVHSTLSTCMPPPCVCSFICIFPPCIHTPSYICFNMYGLMCVVTLHSVSRHSTIYTIHRVFVLSRCIYFLSPHSLSYCIFPLLFPLSKYCPSLSANY